MQHSHFHSVAVPALAERAASQAAAVDAWRLRGNTWRVVLARYAGLPADALPLTLDAHGKPYLAMPNALGFNLSHSGDVVLLVIAHGVAPGVDVEAVRPRPRALQLAQRFFSVDEAATLARLPDAARQQAFYRLWTAKEAVLKALGRGLAFGLDRVGFRLDPDGSAVSPLDFTGDAAPASAWQLHALMPAAGYLGALAWRGAARRVRLFTLVD